MRASPARDPLSPSQLSSYPAQKRQSQSSHPKARFHKLFAILCCNCNCHCHCHCTALHCTALARHPGSHRELRHCKLSLTAHFCSHASPCRLVKSIHHALPFPRKSPAPATSSDRQHRRHYITVLLDPAISVAGSQHYFQGTCQYTPATKCAIAL